MHSNAVMLWPPTAALSALAETGGCQGRAKKGQRVPRPGPFCPVLGEDEKEEGPAGNRVVGHVGGASKPGIQLWAPWTEGFSPTAGLFGSKVTDGLGTAEPAGANTPAQSWQGQSPQPRLAYAGTHMIQVVASHYKYLTPCSHINVGTHKAMLP